MPVKKEVPPVKKETVKKEVPVSKLDKAISEYVHTPGTTHVNAYISDLEEAKVRAAQAQGEVGAAEVALKAKLGIS